MATNLIAGMVAAATQPSKGNSKPNAPAAPATPPPAPVTPAPSGVTQAKQAMAAQGSNPGPGHNSGVSPNPNPDGWLKSCVAWGEKAGAGDTSKVGWFQETVGAAYRGDIIPANAESGYDNFMDGRKRKAAELGKRIIVQESTDPKKGGRAVRISETRKMIRLGALPGIRDTQVDGGMGGMGVFERMLKVVRDNHDIKGEVEELLLKAATAQLASPDVPLSLEAIKGAMTPPVKDKKGETLIADQYAKARAILDKIMRDHEDELVPQTKTARNAIQSRIDALGGTSADVRAKEIEAKKKAAKKNKKK